MKKIYFSISKKNSKNIILYLIIFVLSIILLQHELRKNEKFKNLKNSFIAEITKKKYIFLYGRESYLENIYSTQYNNSSSLSPEAKILESAHLPLDIKSIFSDKFSRVALGGGSLFTINDNVYVLDRLGNFFLVSLPNLKKVDLPKPINNIDSYILNSQLGSGLSDIHLRVISAAYDPSRRDLFVGFTRFYNVNCNKFVISSLHLDPKEILDRKWVDIYVSECVPPKQFSHEGGGRLFISDNKLYFTVGYPDSIGYLEDLGKRDLNNTQDIISSFGKIYEYNLTNKQIQMLSYGHRNPQGLFYNKKTLYESEHGPEGGDEINIIKKGVNYGWPIQTFGTRYGKYNYEVDSIKKHDEHFEEPIFSFVPSIGISNIIVLKNFHSQWNGDLIIGSLKGQSIFRAKLSRTGYVQFVEQIWIGHRIRDIVESKGKIILLTDDSQVILISVNVPLLEKNKKNLLSNITNMDTKIERCLQCHALGQSIDTNSAPNLKNIIGRKIGSDMHFKNYSEGIKNFNAVWDPELLTKYIQDPHRTIPGTTMPNLNISKSESEEIVSILKKYY
jgi:cytochrome c2